MRPIRRPLKSVTSLAGVAVLTAALASCAGEPEREKSASGSTEGYPVKVASCGHTSELDSQPTKIVTLNQGATEVALALGVGDRLAGTAYLDDEVSPRWKKAYDEVPVLSKEYPNREKLLSVDPDFLYASYSSAFDAKVAGSQKELDSQGIDSYLSPFACAKEEKRTGPVTFEQVWDEIDSVGKAFGVPERAAKLQREQRDQLAKLKKNQAGKGLTALWYDSGDKTPTVGAGESGPQLILNTVGAKNVFADLDGGWAEGTWEKVVDADPDVIVLAEAGWSSARDKIDFLEKDPALSKLRAVREKAYVKVPYSASTPGVRMVDGAKAVNEQLSELDTP